MDAGLQLYLLGTPRIVLDGRPLTALTSVKAQALLFYLAVTGQAHTRAALAALLWGDVPDDLARANLRKALQALRQHLDPFLHAERDTVSLAPDAACWVDVIAFEAALHSAADKGDEHLRQAIDLYQGDFLEGFYVRGAPDFEAWWLAEQARLRELALYSIQQLAEHEAAQGDLAQAIALTRRLLALEPWREQDHRRLMGWLAADGQRGAALAQFDACRRILADELGVEPSAETVALRERIRSGAVEPSIPTVSHTPLTAPSAPPFSTMALRWTPPALASRLSAASRSCSGWQAFSTLRWPGRAGSPSSAPRLAGARRACWRRSPSAPRQPTLS